MGKNGAANADMMDLMHRATVAAVDRSRPFQPRVAEDGARLPASGKLPAGNRKRIIGKKEKERRGR